ncbi:protein MAIN-LIKE 1 [Vigna angularis]|uniref:protein MAIN-LIKE 1 n=1 Tax=Phaseolus angularis TaxID=3914 RepID=UPI00080A4F80|nr:protein MAIN-LIKE 1 [Vigna angularis]
MVKPRGGYHGEASSSHSEPSDERRRPTASARRRRVEEYRVDVIHEHDNEEQEELLQHGHSQDDYVEEEDIQQQHDCSQEEHEGEGEDEDEDEVEDGGFPGGPHDTSLLTHYTQHVAFAIWQGRDRRGIKVVTHGKKLKHFGMYHEAIEPYISLSGLGCLVNLSYEYADHGLIVALSEWWHIETNTFHLPIGEMTVTLDDVMNLLHLPIMGQFCEVEELEYDEARSHIMDLLGVDHAKASVEMKQSRGPKVRLSWLREVYQECIQQERWECAARAYLLHLLRCTIFTNKSATLIRVSYLLLLRDLNACSRYAWGAAALAHTYEQLGDASFYEVRQIAGYSTLLQSWIYEHFPTMGRRQVSKRYTELDPRASRYIPPRVGWSLTRGRTFLDALSYDVVIWNPYLSHRRTCPLIAIIMYLGWIRLGDMIHRHLPERVLRQFGFQQNIPRSPDSLPMPDIPTIDLNWLRYAEHAITSVIEADQSHACVDGYITWFRRVSHPYITPGNDDERPSLAPLMRRDIPDERLVPPVRRRRSAELGLLEGMRRVIRMLQGMLTYRDVTEGTVAYQRTTETLQVARRSVEEYESSTRRGGRHVRGRASFS